MSRSTWVFDPERPGTFHLKDYHLLWSRFPADSVKHRFGNFPSLPEKAPIKPHDPDHATLPGYHASSVWAVSRSLAATWKIAFAFYS